MAGPLTTAAQLYMQGRQASRQRQQQEEQNRLLGNMLMGQDSGNLAQLNPQAYMMGAQYQQQQAAATQQAAKDKQLMELRQQYATNMDPEVGRKLVAQDPEMAAQIREQLQVFDDTEKTRVLNQAEGFARMLESDPVKATEYFNQNLRNDPAFADLADELDAGDYSGALGAMGMGITALGGQEAHDQVFGTQQLKDTPEGYYTYNPKTQKFEGIDGAPISPLQMKQRMEASAKDIEKVKDLNERGNKLRSEVNSVAREMGIRPIFAAANKLFAAGEPGAISDMALIFGYMKMLDPGSSVMEGEAANVQNAANTSEKLMNLYNAAIEGVKLSDSQRDQIFDLSKKVYEQTKKGFEQQIKPHLSLAKKSGLTKDDLLGEGFYESFTLDVPEEQQTADVGSKKGPALQQTQPVIRTAKDANGNVVKFRLSEDGKSWERVE